MSGCLMRRRQQGTAVSLRPGRLGDHEPFFGARECSLLRRGARLRDTRQRVWRRFYDRQARRYRARFRARRQLLHQERGAHPRQARDRPVCGPATRSGYRSGHHEPLSRQVPDLRSFRRPRGLALRWRTDDDTGSRGFRLRRDSREHRPPTRHEERSYRLRREKHVYEAYGLAQRGARVVAREHRFV
jgi:hypothetical protein